MIDLSCFFIFSSCLCYIPSLRDLASYTQISIRRLQYNQAYPNFQNISILFLVPSSANSFCSAKLNFSPCNSTTLPVNDVSPSNLSTAFIAVAMGVICMDLNSSLEGAMLVSTQFVRNTPITRRKGKPTNNTRRQGINLNLLMIEIPPQRPHQANNSMFRGRVKRRNVESV